MELCEWLQVGIDNGWVSDAVCDTHEGIPMTEEEMSQWEDGQDPCILAIRVW